VDAAVRFLYETKGIGRVGIIGHSAGAVSAILSAARTPQVGAVAAVAPFNCVTEVWYTSRPPFVPGFIMSWTLWVAERRSGFDREEACALDVVDQIAPRPLLVIHGKADQRVTETQVRRLFAAAKAPKTLWLVPGATHSGIRSPVLDELAPQVIAFFDAALRDQEAPASVLVRRPVSNFAVQ
jgi:dipeptidyl aminopeptidase/acylaminoacyl peptidase